MGLLYDQFWTQLQPARQGCLVWSRCRNRQHYGLVRHRGAARLTHRVAWELTHGPIPSDLDVLHKCDNPPCCNPEHLTLGTAADNVRDAIRRRRVPWGAEMARRIRPYVLRGEAQPNAKLTEAAVREIRASADTHKALAARYGIDRSQISRIRSREYWVHVD